MIEFTNVTKRFGATVALDDVSFRVAPGTIVGFLGPNGASKSTALRLLVGLVRPDAGAATLAGVRYGELPNPGTTVGVLLGAEGFHPGRTGRETLRLACLTLGLPGGQDACAEALARALIARGHARLEPGRRVRGPLEGGQGLAETDEPVLQPL